MPGPRSARGGGHRLIDADEAYAQVLAPGGRVVESTPRVAGRPLVGARVLAGLRAPRFLDATPPRLDPARLLVVPTHVGGHPRFVVVGATLSNSNEALGRVKRLFELAIPVALIVCSAVGWLLAGAALRPVERMRAEAESISASEPGRRLAVPTTDDTLSRLAHTLNATFDRLQRAHDRERRFVDDASHELRTPLTILKAEVDCALAGPRDPHRLARTLESAGEEVDHLVRIAEGLLVLARANHGRIPVHRTRIPLGDLIDECVTAFAARAAGHGVAIDAESEDIAAAVDRTRLRQALDNVLDNAVRHTPSGGSITVRGAARGAGQVAITVEDSGPGFSAEALAGAFQPFNHPVDAHSGAGLGLAIVQAIATAHEGSARVENRPDGGARVQLVVPARVDRAAGVLRVR
jgi:two-component system, OmpR family, sensor kinase